MNDNSYPNSKFPPAVIPTSADSNIIKVMGAITESNSAENFHQQLIKWINEFNNNLDNNYEVGVRLVNFGQTYVFHLLDIGYSNPALIVFYGVTEKNEPVQLIQHVNQISILLMNLPRREPDKPRKTFGFQTN